jgi:hypothetical protein
MSALKSLCVWAGMAISLFTTKNWRKLGRSNVGYGIVNCNL